MPQCADALLEDTVITMDAERRVIRDGAVAVRDGRIAAVGLAAELHEQFTAERSLGGSHRFVILGLIDCHNHLAQALVRDYALEDLPNIYRIYIPAKMAMGSDDARVSVQVAIAQLLRAGVTTVAETTCTPEHEEAIASTVMETGIRGAMARGRGDRVTELGGNNSQVDHTSWYRDDPGALREDLAGTKEFLACWTEKGEGRLPPCVHRQSLGRDEGGNDVGCGLSGRARCDTVINDLFKVMRHAFAIHTQSTGIPLYDPWSFTTEDAMTMATIDGARALRWDAEIESLEVGKGADVVVVDGRNVRLMPAYDPVGTLVRYAVGTDVETVMVAGRVLVEGGRLLTIDEQELLPEAERLGTKLGSVLGPRRYRPLPEQPESPANERIP